MDELEPRESARVLGEYTWGAPGPLLIATGGLHGNEPAGVEAARRVLDALNEHRPPLRGEIVALEGNREALRRGVRYVERDLNRAWWGDDLERLRESGAPRYHGEIGELQELLSEFEARMGQRSEGVISLDLHSTSATGAPFVIMADTVQNRRIAFLLGIPVILGLEELVEGTLLAYVGAQGHVALVVEGGQHDAPTTADHLEAALWLSLVASGMILAEDAPVDMKEQVLILRESARRLPMAIEIRHRHGLRPGDDFRMEPGYSNFHRVEEGEVLAHTGPDGVEEVVSPHDGLLLMPRYQGQGDDGFFIGRELHPFWLKLSTLFRLARVHRILPWLPGIRRDPHDPQTPHDHHSIPVQRDWR